MLSSRGCWKKVEFKASNKTHRKKNLWYKSECQLSNQKVGLNENKISIFAQKFLEKNLKFNSIFQWPPTEKSYCFQSQAQRQRHLQFEILEGAAGLLSLTATYRWKAVLQDASQASLVMFEKFCSLQILLPISPESFCGRSMDSLESWSSCPCLLLSFGSNNCTEKIYSQKWHIKTSFFYLIFFLLSMRLQNCQYLKGLEM